MERLVPSYLQISMETLAKEQDRFRKQFANAFTPQGAFEAYQEQARKNLAMFEQAMSMFTPFAPAKGDKKKEEAGGKKDELAAAAAPPPATPRSPNELDELKTQLASMQAKIDKLSRDRS